MSWRKLQAIDEHLAEIRRLTAELESMQARTRGPVTTDPQPIAEAAAAVPTENAAPTGAEAAAPPAEVAVSIADPPPEGPSTGELA